MQVDRKLEIACHASPPLNHALNRRGRLEIETKGRQLRSQLMLTGQSPRLRSIDVTSVAVSPYS